MLNYPVQSNDNDFDSRMDLVHRLAKDTFKFQTHQVKTVAYEKGYRFPYNNFVFEVEVNPDAVDISHLATQPGVQPIPKGTNKFIIRLPNQGKGFNLEARVANEVAALQLAREALAGVCPVPQVFAWSSGAKDRQGWMLQEMMSGQDLCQDLPEMTDSSRQKVLDQMGLALRTLQNLELPASITSFGGLAFDTSGNIVSSQMSTLVSGPFVTYPALFEAVLRDTVQRSEQHHRIKGWRANGLRDRLESFLSIGLLPYMHNVTMTKKTLVHGDFSHGNFLYDPVSLQLTALLDFDAAYIGTVADEFLVGIGRLPDPGEGDQEAQLSRALLQGFPSPLPESKPPMNWTVVKDWYNVLQVRGVWRPNNIPGIQNLAHMVWLKSLILPGQLRFEHLCPTEEGRDRQRSKGEQKLSDFLHSMGF